MLIYANSSAMRPANVKPNEVYIADQRRAKNAEDGYECEQRNSSNRMRGGESASKSGIADDDSGALLAKHTPLFSLGTPVPAFLAAEETEHARGLFDSLWVLYEGRALVSHLGP